LLSRLSGAPVEADTFAVSLIEPGRIQWCMRKIEHFSDDRNKAWCIYCSQWLSGAETNEDHVPSQSLLHKPHPHNIPKVRVCQQCNSQFSKDEQYLVAFLSSVLTGSTAPSDQVYASATRSLDQSPKLRERIAKSCSTYRAIGGDTRLVWHPEMDRIKRVVVKNARGHAYFELGEPLLDEPVHVWIQPLEFLRPTEREEFETADCHGELAPWPEVGSRMMTRLITGEDMSGPWVIVQEGVYRYSVSQCGGVVVRTVLSEYLATEVYWE
jgi:hypothetical protein